MSKDVWDGHPYNPTLERDKDNTCGFCGESCEYDYCNAECFKARES
jgi:hypothetical protein